MRSSSLRQCLYIFIGAFALAILCAADIPRPVFAQSGCPGSSRPAVASDPVVINRTLKIGDCYDPKTPGINQTSEQSKIFLKSRHAGSGNSCLKNKAQEMDSLNDAFAVCAANFLQAYESKYSAKVQINRGWNSTQCEANLCKGNTKCGKLMDNPAPRSNHTAGVAIDVQTAGQRQMMLFAKQNPQFGVCFPFLDHPTFKDDVHMILGGVGGSEGSAFGCQGVTKPCDGVKFDPNQIRDATPTPPPASAPNTTPTSGLTDIFRQALGMPTQASPLAAQPFAQAPSVLNPFQTQPATAAPTPTAATPASASTPAAASTLPGVSDQISTDINATTATGSSLADKLEGLAFGISTGGATSGTPFIPFFGNPDDNSSSTTASSAIDARYATSTAIVALPTTFSGQGTAQYSYTGTSASQNGFALILANIKNVLTAMLNYIRPFAARQNQTLEMQSY